MAPLHELLSPVTFTLVHQLLTTEPRKVPINIACQQFKLVNFYVTQSVTLHWLYNYLKIQGGANNYRPPPRDNKNDMDLGS